MAVPLPQEGVPSQRDPAGQAAIPSSLSTGPSHLASSLARLQHFEDSELRGPSPSMKLFPQQTRPSDCSVGDSHKGPCGNTSGIYEIPAASAHDGMHAAEYLSTSKAEQTLPPALRRHAADLSSGDSSRAFTHSSLPVPHASAADTPHAEKEVHEHYREAGSMQSTLADELPKVGPQTIISIEFGEVAGMEKLSQPLKGT